NSRTQHAVGRKDHCGKAMVIRRRRLVNFSAAAWNMNDYRVIRPCVGLTINNEVTPRDVSIGYPVDTPDPAHVGESRRADGLAVVEIIVSNASKDWWTDRRTVANRGILNSQGGHLLVKSVVCHPS